MRVWDPGVGASVAGARHPDPASARPFPHRQHVGGLVAVQDGVSQPHSADINPASRAMGTAARPTHLCLPYPRDRQHDRRRRLAALGGFGFSYAIPPGNPRVDIRDTSNERRGARARLAQHLREHSVAASSHKRYARAFAIWCAWSAKHGFDRWLGDPSIAPVHAISEFIMDTALNGFGSGHAVRGSTVQADLLGIRHFFLAAGHAFPIDQPHIRMLLKGIARHDAPSSQQSPALVSLLEEAFRALDLRDPADQALWGVLCLAFFFLLRRSEIVATSGTTFQWFALKAIDVVVVDTTGATTTNPGEAQSVFVKLHGSKCNQSGKPVARLLARSGHPLLCPVLGALHLLRARRGLHDTAPTAEFVDRNGRSNCITATRVTRAIQSAAAAIGEDPKHYGTHSLRAGGATNMYRAGIDALTIQLHDRWASDSFKLYTRLCSEAVTGVASKIVNGSKSPLVLQ